MYIAYCILYITSYIILVYFILHLYSFSRERLRRVFRKKAAVVIHLHTLTSADLHLHTLTDALASSGTPNSVLGSEALLHPWKRQSMISAAHSWVKSLFLMIKFPFHAAGKACIFWSGKPSILKHIQSAWVVGPHFSS